MPENVTDEWLALPARRRAAEFGGWWSSLSDGRQAEARRVGAGQDLPRWMWRTLLHPRRHARVLAMLRAGHATATMPAELVQLVARQRPRRAGDQRGGR